MGAQVDVHVPGAGAYRDFTLLMQDVDDSIGQSHMPYPTDVKGITTVNYRSGKRTVNDVDPAYSSASGDPATPILKAYVGDPVEVHALVAPGSEQMHTFSLGGLSWPIDPFIPMAEQIQARGLGPWEGLQANITGGAGGGSLVGDMFYGDLRRPFTAGGLWGLQRVMANGSCPIKPLDGLSCTGGVVSALAKPKLAPGSDTGTSPIDNVTKDSMPTFTGAAAANATIHLYVDGNQVATGQASATGSWSIGSTALTDGNHVVTFTQNASGGGESPQSDPLTVRIDTVGPDVLLTGGPTNPTANASPQFDFGPQFAGIAFECSLSTGADAYAPCTSPKVYPGLVDGSYTFKLRGTDIAGNTGAVASMPFTLTTTPTP